MTDAQNKAVEAIKEAFQAVPMATAEQVEELYQLIIKSNIPVDMLILWKKKAGVERFSDMDADKVEKCIKYLKERIENASK
jgi:hypothetical protein